MRRKILAVLLAAAMALSLLAGCGGKALSQVIVDLLDGLYSNVSVEADSDLTAALKQAAAEGGTEEEILSRMIEILNHNGGSITFTRLGSGQQGDHAVTLYFQTGTDPDAAARNALAQWAGTLGTLPDDGSYQADVAMIETENGYYIALDVEVLKAGTPDKPDKDDDEPEPQEPEKDPYTKNADGSYTVNTKDGLQQLVEDLNWPADDAILSANITLEEDVTLTGNWEPIGNNETPYTGTFNGNDKTVTGLAITSSNRYVGMFGYVTGTVQNVNLASVTVTSDYTVEKAAGYTGAVAGYLSSKGTITGCSVSGNVTITGTNGNAGGVVGSSYGAISNCKVYTLTITGASSNGNVAAGGVAGTNSKTIENCQVDDLTITDVTIAGGVMGRDGSSNAALTGCSVNDSSVTGSNHAGGVAGILSYGNLAGCSVEKTTITTNSPLGTGKSGGVIGGQNGGTAMACYFANGSINGNGAQPDLGGVAGGQRGGSIIACYSTGGFGASSTSHLGGVVGNRSTTNGVVTDCYWSGTASTGISGMNPVPATKVTDEEEWNHAISKDNKKGLNGSANISGYTFGGTMDAPSFE